MKPIRFIESEGLLLCGNKGNDVGSAWRKWESTSVDYELKHAIPYDANNNPGAFEARFYPDGGEFDFVGIQVGQREPGTAWEYMRIPAAIYAVFEIDCKIDQGPQYNELNEWLNENEVEYKRFKWDADGQIVAAEFVLCVYDHTEKFAKQQIMEIWIPVEKTSK